MGRRVVAKIATYDRHVGLGLRGVVERDWRLGAHVPALAEGPGERPLHEADRDVVGRALGLRHHQQAVDQLDTIAGHEHALVHELLVLDPLPPLELEPWSRHGDAHPREV
jgi:hypothetical protein